MRRRASALRRTSAAGGQTVGDHQVDRLPRLAAARERRVIRPRPSRRTPNSATRPTQGSPNRTDRGRRARATPDPRSTPPAPRATPATRPPAPCRSRAHPRQATCAHAARSASTFAFPPVQPTSMHATDSHRAPLTVHVRACSRPTTPAAPADAPHVDLADVAAPHHRGASVIGGSSPSPRPASAPGSDGECFAQRRLRVIQQRSQLLEQLLLPLPDGTRLGVQQLLALCPLALAVHV